MPRTLNSFALNCSLKPSNAKEKSSTDRILQELIDDLSSHGVENDIKPGVLSDEGEGDDWPELRGRILAADIFLLGLPIWLGQPSSIAKRVLERMDAFLSETDERGRMPAAGKVALVAIVGNEDGAHHCHAACFQALNDVGFTIATNAGVYWVGEAMGKINYVDLEKSPDPVKQTRAMAAANAAHLAGLLKQKAYEGVPE